MNHAIAGHCHKCGEPIYAPAVWGSILPPPSTYSCNCYSEKSQTKSLKINSESKF